MAITRSFFIQSRRAIRRNLRLEKTNQIVKFPGHKTILKGPKYPFQFRPELKSHIKHCFQKSNIDKILKPLLISQIDQTLTPNHFESKNVIFLQNFANLFFSHKTSKHSFQRP